MYPRKPIVDQRVDIAVGHRVDAAAPATVASIRTPARHVLLTAKTGSPIPAVAADHFDDRFIDELHERLPAPLLRKRMKRSVSSPRRWPSHTLSHAESGA